MIISQDLLRESSKAAKTERVYEQFALAESFRYDGIDTYDLFISHSFSDKELVVGLRYLFNKAGYNVYIDWVDDRNLDRKNVTKATADVIKNRIKNSKALAYISTVNITSSKWCPWELGVADGMHNKACILPVMDSQFKGQEYLGLYPYLDFAKTSMKNKDEFWVYDSDDRKKYVVLRDWLKGKEPYSR